MIKFDAYEAEIDDVGMYCFDSDGNVVMLEENPKQAAEITGLSQEAIGMLQTFVVEMKKAVKNDLVSIAE